MRNAEQVLGVIRQRGIEGKPLEDIYRQLYNPDLYLVAYARLSKNQGALTPGTTAETVDGMTLAKIEQLIADLRCERYRWTPVRRTYIPKANGKLRPLGIPTWSDKLLQEVIRLVLEAYYEPQFSEHSHGFRPGRGCHTALRSIQGTWTGTKWFIEGDIKGAFDNIDHKVLLSILQDKLHDNRFLRLIQNLLEAGYLEEWHYHRTLSGTPQGGVVSPILSNVYLDRLDQFIEQKLLPAYNTKAGRARSREYARLRAQMVYRWRSGAREKARMLRKKLQAMPSLDPHDPDYRRLRYIRYADDWLLGYVGTKKEAEAIRDQLKVFLHDTLKLELSEEKTLITHATTQAARFLGYEIVTRLADDRHDQTGRRSLNGRIALRLPVDVLRAHVKRYQKNGKAAARPEMLHDDDYTIMTKYQAEYRGVVQYYLLADNVGRLQRLHWEMQTSLLRTLAWKHNANKAHKRVSVQALARKYRAIVATPHGPRKCLQVVVERKDGKPLLVAQFGGIPLHRKEDAVLAERAIQPYMIQQNELVKRLVAGACELCGSQEAIEVHHVRKLADLKKPGREEKPVWMQVMIARQRKTLILCHKCHVAIQHGRPNGKPKK